MNFVEYETLKGFSNLEFAVGGCTLVENLRLEIKKDVGLLSFWGSQVAEGFCAW